MASYITTFFFVVISMIGFITVYTQIDAGTRERVVHMRTLDSIQAIYPLIIYICALQLLLRYLYGASVNPTLFWIFVNIQSTILIYSSLLTTNLVSFAIIQLFGALTYVTTGAMTPVNWALFLCACFLIYAVRWYGRLWGGHLWLYITPAILVGALFWLSMYLRPPKPLPLGLAIANFISFAWAYFALWNFDQYQQNDQRVLTKLTREVQYDALTQAQNWATFRRDLNTQFADQAQHPLTLITMDIDHFKEINDTYGHLMGNQTLIAFSRQMQHLLHMQNDHYQFYRTGGEEFAILLPNTTLSQGRQMVEICQHELQNLAIPLTNGRIQITASFGLATARDSDDNATGFFKRGDRYLYHSKQNGRNRLTDENTFVS